MYALAVKSSTKKLEKKYWWEHFVWFITLNFDAPVRFITPGVCMSLARRNIAYVLIVVGCFTLQDCVQKSGIRFIVNL